MTGNEQRQRAEHALRCVRRIEKSDAKLTGAYRSYVEALGAAIVMNGLGQALVTERAAAREKPTKPGERAHLQLYENLSSWLKATVYTGMEEIVDAIMKGTQEDYLWAQVEALAWLTWHKKFCQAYLPRGESGTE